jgi:beta-N-acetylhexosaminidase
VKAAIIGVVGPTLHADEIALIREHRPAGVILFARNVVDPAQLQALTAHLSRILPPLAVIMVDQEGGRVARLRPPHWREHPAAATLGALFGQDGPAGLRAAWLTGALIGLDVREAGIEIVCAPVLDLAVAGATAAIGDRAFAADPDAVGELGAAFAAGLLAAGVQPVAKHAPGHGRAGADSHAELPRLPGVAYDDLVPFARCAHLPWMMTAHIVYAEQDPERPATLSPVIIQDVLRDDLGFEGVLVSDDLAMHALTGSPGERVTAALAAGCDLALHCSGVLADSADALAVCPAPTEAALQRLRSAVFLADRSRQRLDPDALAAERRVLLNALP